MAPATPRAGRTGKWKIIRPSWTFHFSFAYNNVLKTGPSALPLFPLFQFPTRPIPFSRRLWEFSAAVFQARQINELASIGPCSWASLSIAMAMAMPTTPTTKTTTTTTTVTITITQRAGLSPLPPPFYPRCTTDRYLNFYPAECPPLGPSSSTMPLFVRASRMLLVLGFRFWFLTFDLACFDSGFLLNGTNPSRWERLGSRAWHQLKLVQEWSFLEFSWSLALEIILKKVL